MFTRTVCDTGLALSHHCKTRSFENSFLRRSSVKRSFVQSTMAVPAEPTYTTMPAYTTDPMPAYTIQSEAGAPAPVAYTIQSEAGAPAPVTYTTTTAAPYIMPAGYTTYMPANGISPYMTAMPAVSNLDHSQGNSHRVRHCLLAM